MDDTSLEEIENKELLDHIFDVSSILRTLNMSDEDYQNLIIKQAKLARYIIEHK